MTIKIILVNRCCVGMYPAQRLVNNLREKGHTVSFDVISTHGDFNIPIVTEYHLDQNQLTNTGIIMLSIGNGRPVWAPSTEWKWLENFQSLTMDYGDFIREEGTKEITI